MPHPRRERRQEFLAAIAIIYLVCVVFFPILHFEFIDFDVHDQVVANPHIQGLTGENLKQILTSPCVTSYYPVRTLTYALDFQLWGLNPFGFKLTNGLIHLANVLLVFRLILRLFERSATAGHPPEGWREVSVAAFFAGVFGIHPVVVEPVTWVAGREELLMTLGALGCFHFHLTARGQENGNHGKRKALWCHVLAACCCAAACLSNAVGAVIPLLIVAWDVLSTPRPRLRRIVTGTAALWAIGATTIAIKTIGYTSELLDVEAAAFSAERLGLIFKVYWLDLAALVWPAGLTVYYGPLAPESFLEAEVILGGAAVLLTCAVAWNLRHRKLILFGLAWFVLALGPTSQILPHHIHRADRFLYLPLAGLVAALALGMRPLGRKLRGGAAVTGAVAIGVLCLLLLARLDAPQVQTWRNSLSVWEHCLRVDPDNVLGHRALADNLANRGRFDEAVPLYEKALEIDPNALDVLNNFAFRLATCEEKELRDYRLALELAKRGCRLTEWKDSTRLHTLATVYNNLGRELADRRHFAQAIHCFGQSLQAEPDNPAALLRLSLLWATCRDETLRRPDEAIRLADRARRVVGQPECEDLLTLAAVYGHAGRFETAVEMMEEALRLARAAGDANLLARLQSQLKCYRDGVLPNEVP